MIETTIFDEEETPETPVEPEGLLDGDEGEDKEGEDAGTPTEAMLDDEKEEGTTPKEGSEE